MKTVSVKKRDVARELTKGYMRLLTAAANAAKAVDDYFISEEDAEIRPYFYGSLTFGIAIVLLILWTVV